MPMSRGRLRFSSFIPSERIVAFASLYMNIFVLTLNLVSFMFEC